MGLYYSGCREIGAQIAYELNEDLNYPDTNQPEFSYNTSLNNHTLLCFLQMNSKQDALLCTGIFLLQLKAEIEILPSPG